MVDFRETLPPNTDLSMLHLQAELARIDLFIRRQVRLWQMANQNLTDPYRGLYISPVEAEALLNRPFSSVWGEGVSLPQEEEKAFNEAEEQATHRMKTLIEKAKEKGQIPRLLYLALAFNLNRFELDTLLICLAVALDPRYGRIYSYLQDDVTRKLPSINLVLQLLGKPGPERLLLLTHFATDAPLIKYRLLERITRSNSSELALIDQALSLDETVAIWLLGKYQPHADLGRYTIPFWTHSKSTEVDTLIATEIWLNLELLLHSQPIVIFYGVDQTRQEIAAKFCAAKAGRSLLKVNLAGMIEEGVPPFQVLNLALRDARLISAIPYLSGWDVFLTKGEAPPAEISDMLHTYPDLIFTAGEKFWKPQEVNRARRLIWFEFPFLNHTQRSALWQHLLNQIDLAEEIDLDMLVSQFVLTTGQIRDAVALAKDKACHQNRPLSSQDIFAAVRAYSNPNLASLARKIEPRYTWSDLILPADQLAIFYEIVTAVRERPLVLDKWGVGQKLVSSTGITVLFAGPPGTGKTMAAEVLAGELKLDLYKINLSTVVSKYIGETEKNLENIFNEAKSSNAILFFDEADAIFGKRSEVKEAHDRYANIEISYLLQRMETYDGITILATNLRANLDSAFIRRLQFAIDFPFPEQADRLRIWQTLFPPNVPREENLNFHLLAQRFDFTGGEICNVIVNAAYQAAADKSKVTMTHLLHSVRRELQKTGRLMSDKILELDQ